MVGWLVCLVWLFLCVLCCVILLRCVVFCIVLCRFVLFCLVLLRFVEFVCLSVCLFGWLFGVVFWWLSILDLPLKNNNPPLIVFCQGPLVTLGFRRIPRYFIVDRYQSYKKLRICFLSFLLVKNKL